MLEWAWEIFGHLELKLAQILVKPRGRITSLNLLKLRFELHIYICTE